MQLERDAVGPAEAFESFPEVLLPAQIDPGSRFGLALGERRLLWAMLLDAATCFYKHRRARDNNGRKLFREAERWIRSREERRDGPWVGDEQPSVGTRQAAQILRPVVRWRLGLEAAQDPIQERVDEVVLGGEVVVQRHRRGAEVTGDGPHGEGVEPLRRDGLGGVEDDFGCE